MNWAHSPSIYKPYPAPYVPSIPITHSLYHNFYTSFRSATSTPPQAQQRLQQHVLHVCKRWLAVSRRDDSGHPMCDDYNDIGHARYSEAMASDVLDDDLPGGDPSPIKPSHGLDLSYAIRSSAQPILADQVALPTSLNILPMATLLPANLATAYSGPSNELLLTQDLLTAQVTSYVAARGKALTPKAHATSEQYAKLIQRMAAVGMIASTTQPKCINGLFAVPKPDGSQRIIIDARMANLHFTDPPKVDLPSPTHLASIQVRTTDKLYVAKMDLSNFYHHIGLPTWMQPYFCLPPLEPVTRGQQPVYPMCTTLPMGFSHAVYLAQQVHNHCLYSRAALNPRWNVLRLSQPLLTQTIHALYIDDNCLLGTSETDVQQQYELCLAAYTAAGLLAKREKCTAATTEPTEVLGITVDGYRQQMYVAPTKMRKLLGQTVYMLSKTHCTGQELARLLGHWTWAIMLRRPAFAMLRLTYIYINTYKHINHQLWPCVRDELLALIGIAPMLYANIAAPISSFLPATDASMTGYGVVMALSECTRLNELWPLATYKPSDHMTDDNASGLMRPSNQQLQLLRDLRFTTIIAGQWRYGVNPTSTNHINELELQAVYSMVKHLLSRPSTMSTRVLHLVDNTVTFSSLRKGRCSSVKLLLCLRKLAVHLIAADMVLLPVWIPSEANPADAPSRL